ncbi:hypothetical protein AAVH_07085 [Aphelenchoides avenae]|nr:hypothetical protein AAVH_07085 [Aphelenchus avenae]
MTSTFAPQPTTDAAYPNPAVPVTATPPLRIAGATSYAILSIVSLLLNAILIRIFIKHRKLYDQSTFYQLSWQLIVGDVGTQLMQLIIAVPVTYAGVPVYGEGVLLHVVAGFDTIFYASTLIFSVLMTLNRATIFLASKIHRILFTPQNLYWTILVCWLIVLCITALLNASGCYKTFETNGYYLYHKCQSPLSKTAYTVWYNFATYSPVGMIVMYIVVILHLRYLSSAHAAAAYTEQDRSKRRQEQRLLFQSFLICGSLEVQNLAFNFLPMLGAKGQWEYVMNFVANWISIANNSMTPVVLFIFNQGVQSRLLEMFGAGRRCKRGSQTVTLTSSTATRSMTNVN